MPKENFLEHKQNKYRLIAPKGFSHYDYSKEESFLVPDDFIFAKGIPRTKKGKNTYYQSFDHQKTYDATMVINNQFLNILQLTMNTQHPISPYIINEFTFPNKKTERATFPLSEINFYLIRVAESQGTFDTDFRDQAGVAFDFHYQETNGMINLINGKLKCFECIWNFPEHLERYLSKIAEKSEKTA